MLRRVAAKLIASLVLALALSAGGARASSLDAQDAASFIRSLGEEAIQMLSDKSLGERERNAQFRKLLSAGFDLKTIGRFVLGRHAQRANESAMNEFQRLFESYVVQTYAARLGQYSGETFKVTTSRRDDSGDTLVFTDIVPKEGAAVRVEWRVRGEPGRFRIIDVIVEGVSMAITQRQEFAAVIQRTGGDGIDGLIAELRRKVPAGL